MGYAMPFNVLEVGSLTLELVAMGCIFGHASGVLVCVRCRQVGVFGAYKQRFIFGSSGWWMIERRYKRSLVIFLIVCTNDLRQLLVTIADS